MPAAQTQLKALVTTTGLKCLEKISKDGPSFSPQGAICENEIDSSRWHAGNIKKLDYQKVAARGSIVGSGTIL